MLNFRIKRKSPERKVNKRTKVVKISPPASVLQRLTKIVPGENYQALSSSLKEYVFRSDTRDFDAIYQAGGFHPKGEHLNIDIHGSGTPGYFVSTAGDQSGALNVAPFNSNMYLVQKPAICVPPLAVTAKKRAGASMDEDKPTYVKENEYAAIGPISKNDILAKRPFYRMPPLNQCVYSGDVEVNTAYTRRNYTIYVLSADSKEQIEIANALKKIAKDDPALALIPDNERVLTFAEAKEVQKRIEQLLTEFDVEKENNLPFFEIMYVPKDLSEEEAINLVVLSYTAGMENHLKEAIKQKKLAPEEANMHPAYLLIQQAKMVKMAKEAEHLKKTRKLRAN